MTEKLTKEKFTQLAAFEQVFKAQQQLSPLDTQSFQGTLLVVAAAAHQLALSKTDVLSLLDDSWAQWAQYKAVRAELAKRAKK